MLRIIKNLLFGAYFVLRLVAKIVICLLNCKVGVIPKVYEAFKSGNGLSAALTLCYCPHKLKLSGVHVKQFISDEESMKSWVIKRDFIIHQDDRCDATVEWVPMSSKSLLIENDLIDQRGSMQSILNGTLNSQTYHVGIMYRQHDMLRLIICITHSRSHMHSIIHVFSLRSLGNWLF